MQAGFLAEVVLTFFFILVIFIYLLKRRKIFNDSHQPVFNRLVTELALPVTIFSTLAVSRIQFIVQQPEQPVAGDSALNRRFHREPHQLLLRSIVQLISFHQAVIVALADCSEDEHAVAVAVESILLLYSQTIALVHQFAAGKGTNQH